MALYRQRALLQGAEVQLFRLMSSSATPEQWAEWLLAPLERAAAYGSLALVTRLLEAGAIEEAGWKECDGQTLLDAAVVGGNVRVVSALLLAGAGPSVNVPADSPGRSPLYLAIKGGHEGAAKKILSDGADVNFMDPDDQRGPLHPAAEGGYDDLVADMLSAGAFASLRTGDGKTPLHLAAKNGHDTIVSLLLNSWADKAGENEEEEEEEEYGFSQAVGTHCEEGHLSSVEFYVTGRVDPNLRTDDGASALDLAAQGGHVDVLKSLLKKGADVNDGSFYGYYTALHAVAESTDAGAARAVRVLVDAGARINARSTHGETPLYFAASESASVEVVLALLREGANANEADTDGFTPLHMACRGREKDLPEIVDLLLRWGASEKAVNKKGETPIDVLLDVKFKSRTCSKDDVESTRVLLERAPAGRSWRRRGWLVMLRSHAAERKQIAQRGGDGSGGMEGVDEMVLGDGKEAGAGDDDAENNRAGRGGGGVGDEGILLSRVVTVLLGLHPQNVFRTIVGYL